MSEIPLPESFLSVHVDLGERSYTVRVGSKLIGQLGTFCRDVLPNRLRAVVISDSNVAPRYADTAIESLQNAGVSSTLITVPAGEASKSLSQAQSILSEMVAASLDRKSFVVALGGGVIGDLAGFCAAVYQRGIPYIQIPTTVLAQVDSSVGGKTGVNLPEAKNLVGSFHQPALVLADVSTLDSLPIQVRHEGFAEIIKHAAIQDASMFDAIDSISANGGSLTDLIHRNIAIKARIVEQDEFETVGLRALLNFGHTLGHAIEAAAGYGELLHGEAISLGLRAAAWLSVRHSSLTQSDAARIEKTLADFQLPLTLPDQPPFQTDTLIGLARSDKKFDHGRIRFVLLRTLGEAFVSHDLTEADLRAAIDHLRTPPTPLSA